MTTRQYDAVMRALLIALSIGALVATAAACGDGADGSGGSDSDDADSDGNGSAKSSGGQGANGQGGDGAGGHDPADFLGFGSVGVYSYDYVAGTTPVRTSGAWAAYGLTGTGSNTCTVTDHGRCKVYDCPITTTQPPPPTYVPAGTISIGGGQRAITLTPALAEYPSESDTMNTLFAGGETLTFDVAGEGDVPPHQASLIAPSPVTVAGFGTTPAQVDRSAPYGIAWSGGSAGDVHVALSATESSGGQPFRSVSAQCDFDAAAGSGAIPTDALALFPATSPPDVVGSVSVSVIASTTVEAGDYLVFFQASTLALNPAGSAASAAADIF